MKLTSLAFLGSWETIYVHFNIIEVENREGNPFEGDRNIKFAQLINIMSNHKKAREMKMLSF